VSLLAGVLVTLAYWVEPCTDPTTGCQKGDVELAEWALARWQTESHGLLVLRRTPEREQAQIYVTWAGAQEGMYGEMRPIAFGNRTGAQLFIRPDLSALGREIASDGAKDPLFRDAVVYLTCLHESGHALGLPHTNAFDDIMYSFQYGGDIPEYFQRFRRKLTRRDDLQRVSAVSEQDRRMLERALDRRPRE
jgi:hypothetical protein